MPARPDLIIDALAARQHGVVARRQLLAAGVSVHVVERRIRTGRLVRIHAGVYRVGPVVAPLARETAGALACGDGALVSHGSAAALWRFLPARSGREQVEISVPRGVRRRPGLRVHCMSTLTPGDATRLEGIPITTPARTLFDLASRMMGRALERAVAEAMALRLVDAVAIERICAAHPRAPGSGRLRALLAAGAPGLTRSEAEERFLALIREAGLPAPETNVRVEGLEVDCLWRPSRLVVEVDGYAFHSSRAAHRRDRERDGILIAAGYTVLRVDPQQIVEGRLGVVGVVARALGRGESA